MQFFPAQYSTLSAAALQQWIAERYGYDGLSCRLLLHGMSDTYLLENERPQYILKVYRRAHRSAAAISSELELLNILREKGAAVAYPIADREGRQLQTFQAAEGPRNGVLFSYAKGKNVYDFSEAQLGEIGHAMAAVHNISAGISLSQEREVYDLERLLLRPLRTVEPAFADIPECYAYLSATAEKVVAALETLHTPAFSKGYCHYDFLPKNFHLDEQDHVTFFDFDFAGKGWLANDHASFFIHFFFHSALGKMTPAAAARDFATFLQAYREVRPFSDSELAAVPYLGFIFFIFYLGVQYENYDDWTNAFFSTAYLKDRTALIKRYVDTHCHFPD